MPAFTESKLARSAWFGGIADTLLLLVPLGLANAWWAKDDPGFLAHNPSPWLLLPLVLGARMGLLAGQVGAMLAAVAVLLGFRYFQNTTNLATVVTGHAWFFVSLLAAGAVGGLIHALLAGPARAARQQASDLARSEQRLRNEVELLRQSTDDLSHRLLLQGADFLSLQDRARQLFNTDAMSVPVERGLLNLLKEMFGITACSIHHRNDDRDRSWNLVACLGDPDQPAHGDHFVFDAVRHPVAAAAIAEDDLATCASLSNTPTAKSASKGHAAAPACTGSTALAAIPWSDRSCTPATPSRLLVIDRIPFAAATWENFARIQALFQWTMSVASTTDFKRREKPSSTVSSLPDMLSPEQFNQQLNAALDCAEALQLGFRLVLFERTATATTAGQNAFVKSALAQRRAGDIIGGVVLAGPNANSRPRYGIALLVPLDSDSATTDRITTILRPVPGGQSSIDYQILPVTADRQAFLDRWQPLTLVEAPAATPTPSAGETVRANGSVASAPPVPV